MDTDPRSSDRGRHLVDLLAEGLGHDQPPDDAGEHYPRVFYVLGGTSIALLFTAVTAAILH